MKNSLSCSLYPPHPLSGKFWGQLILEQFVEREYAGLAYEPNHTHNSEMPWWFFTGCGRATVEDTVTRRWWFQAQTRQRLTTGLGGRDLYVNTGDTYITWAHTAVLAFAAFNNVTSMHFWRELAAVQMCKSLVLSENLGVPSRKLNIAQVGSLGKRI